MYLLYIDESGDVEDAADHFVVGGVAVHEGDVDFLKRDVARVVERHLHAHLSTMELHAQWMRKGKGGWRSIPAAVRDALLRDICDLLGDRQRELVKVAPLFAVVRSPQAVPGADPLERCFEELFLRFTQMLIRVGRQSEERGIVVADEAKYEKTLQPVTDQWRNVGTRFARLSRLAEVPLFVDSKATRLIQVADIVAHATYLAYRDADMDLFDRLVGGFDEDKGTMHGLTHLTPARAACTCVACASRNSKRK